MKTRLKTIIIFLLPGLFIFSGCSKSNDALFSDLPVVESYLVPGSKVKVKISQKAPYLSTVLISDTNVSNLQVNIIYHGRTYLLTSCGSGIYIDSAGLIPILGDSTYALSFTYHGNLITAKTIIPTVPSKVKVSDTTITFAQFDYATTPVPGTQPDPIILSWSNPDYSHYMVTMESIDSNAVSVIKDSVPSSRISSEQPFTGDTARIHTMMFKYFGRNRIILYHMNAEYINFFSQTVSTTQNYQDPPTNIVNGLGIFTGINTDTLYIRAIKK